MKPDILVTLALLADILFLGYSLDSFLQGPGPIAIEQEIFMMRGINLATFIDWATSWPANLAIALMIAGLLFLALHRPASSASP
jgi:hypothetical protein